MKTKLSDNLGQQLYWVCVGLSFGLPLWCFFLLGMPFCLFLLASLCLSFSLSLSHTHIEYMKSNHGGWWWFLFNKVWRNTPFESETNHTLSSMPRPCWAVKVNDKTAFLSQPLLFKLSKPADVSQTLTAFAFYLLIFTIYWS